MLPAPFEQPPTEPGNIHGAIVRLGEEAATSSGPSSPPSPLRTSDVEAGDLRIVVGRLVSELGVHVDRVVLDRNAGIVPLVTRIWSRTCELPSNTYE